MLSKLVQQITSFKIFSSKKFIHISLIHLYVAKYYVTLIEILSMSMKFFSNVVKNIFSVFCPRHQKTLENIPSCSQAHAHVHRLIK